MIIEVPFNILQFSFSILSNVLCLGNFILDQDLRESLLPTASTNQRLSLLSSANERLSGVLDLNNDVSNQENVPVDTDNVLNVTETRNIVTPRTPLSSLKTCVDQGGNQVNLKEARIMLNNVGVSNENSPAVTPVGTRKKTMTLDELFSFGVRGTPTEPETTNKRKYGSDSQVVANNKPQKKPRTTEISSANVKLQNLEVRLEKNVVQPRRSSENSTTNISEPNEREGRSRRQKTQVSYKEPSLMKKMRREGDTSSLNYGELKPPQKKKIGRKKKLDSG